MTYDPNQERNSGYGTPPYGVPPQGSFGAPPYQQAGFVPRPSEATPLPLGEAIRDLPRQYIRVLTRPSAATFFEEQGKAAWNIVWVQLIGLSILGTIFAFLFYQFVFPVFLNTMLHSSNLNGSSPPVNFSALFQIFSSPLFALATLISVPIGFFISVGIYHLIAKAFGGTGTFLAYCYSYLLYGVPIALVTYLVILIPVVGVFLTSPVSIYSFVLLIFMTMGVHRLSGGKATLVAFTPVIAAFVLSCVGFVILFAVILSVTHLH